jgi:hypothetical protein
MVYDGFCENCNAKIFKWCRECQINYLKNKFISNDNNINKFIQKVRLDQRVVDDNVFEWIPYDHLNITHQKIGSGSTTMYLATWIDGPLSYHFEKKGLIRESPNKGVALKYLYNPQNITKVLDEV